MTEHPPTSVEFVPPGAVPTGVGSSPWLNTRDDGASYLEQSAEAVAGVRCYWPAIPAAAGKPLRLLLRAETDGVAWFDIWGVSEAEGPFIGYTPDIPPGGWVDVMVGVEPDGYVVPDGPFSLTLDFDQQASATFLRVTYVAILTDDEVTYRRIFPRDDGLAGGPRRNYPSSKGVQFGNRTSGYL